MRCRETRWLDVEVEADSPSEAEAKALEEAGETDFDEWTEPEAFSAVMRVEQVEDFDP